MTLPRFSTVEPVSTGTIYRSLGHQISSTDPVLFNTWQLTARYPQLSLPSLQGR